MSIRPFVNRLFGWNAYATSGGVAGQVRQLNLVDYCSVRSLTLVERLRLIDEVCGLVQENHLKGQFFLGLRTDHIVVAELEGVRSVEILADTRTCHATKKSRPDLAGLVATDLWSLGQIIRRSLEDLNPLPPLLYYILDRASQIGASRFLDVSQFRDVVRMYVRSTDARSSVRDPDVKRETERFLTPLPVARSW